MIYKDTVFKKLIDSIDLMDSPFDSKPLKSIICDENNKSSYVSWPNIVVADVEKEGIRDSRSQSTYASRFRWKMQEFPTNYKRWRSKTVKLFESTPENWPKKNKLDLVLAVTTVNRWDYLEEFLTSWLATKNDGFNWTLVVADDGSIDGTLSNLVEYDIPNTKLVVLQNNGSGIARQTNSIFNYVMGLERKPELIFRADDDIFFKNKGWDKAYLDAVSKTGYDHLVHLIQIGNLPCMKSSFTKNSVELVSMTDGISCMGCFYTVTPKLLSEVGDLTRQNSQLEAIHTLILRLRACRLGFNDLNTLYDINDATDYLGIHPKEGYVSTHRKYSFTEQMILADHY